MATGYGIAGDIGSRGDKGFDGLPSRETEENLDHIFGLLVPGAQGLQEFASCSHKKRGSPWRKRHVEGNLILNPAKWKSSTARMTYLGKQVGHERVY